MLFKVNVSISVKHSPFIDIAYFFLLLLLDGL